MSRFAWLLCTVVLCVHLPVVQVDADEIDTSILAIVEQVRKPSPLGLNKTGVEEISLSLRNEASTTITAWKVSCLQSENDGNFAVGSFEIDSFLELEQVNARGPILPGEAREVIVPAKAWEPTQPYVSVQCGVTAVVLADSRYAGVASDVHSILDARARMLSEVLEAAGIVDRMIETGMQPLDAHRLSDPDLRATIRTAEEVLAKSGGLIQLQSTLQYLRDKAEFIAGHVPTNWSRLSSEHAGMLTTEGGDR